MKDKYDSYTEACNNFNLEKLHQRRLKLCLKFCKKEYNKPGKGIFQKMKFKSKRKIQNRKVVKEPKTRTNRYYKSSIPYLSRLFNNDVSAQN